MIRLLFCTILCFVYAVSAFEPLKNVNAAVFWDYDSTINAEEVSLMKQKIMAYLKAHTNVVNESDIVPVWLKKHHHGYNSKTVTALNSEIDHKIDDIILVHYERKIVYDLPGSTPIHAFVPYALVRFDMTDDDPDWCHQSNLSIDVYNRTSGKRVYTFISNQESGSMNSYDQEEFNDNIDKIAEDIDEHFIDENCWNIFTSTLHSQKQRDTVSVSTAIKKRLVNLFGKFSTDITNVPIKIGIDEYGNVFNVTQNSNAASATSHLVDTFFTSINFGRKIVPNDTEYINVELTQDNFKNIQLINGYYANISGYRGAEEVWKIMQWHIDQFVHKKNMMYGDWAKEYLHIGFVINKNGNVENLQFLDGTKNALKREQKNIKIISGWEFGNKNDDRDMGTKVESVFSLEENKIHVK
jgi:hypothetical protein